MNMKVNRDFKLVKSSHIQAKILIPKKKIIALRKASHLLGPPPIKRDSSTNSPLTLMNEIGPAG